jgi:hypothetical protein
VVLDSAGFESIAVAKVKHLSFFAESLKTPTLHLDLRRRQ